MQLNKWMYIRKGYKDMIKNLIFDVGGVLFDYRWKEMFMDYGLDEDNAIRVGCLMILTGHGIFLTLV